MNLKEIIQKIYKRKMSFTELVDFYLDNIKKKDKNLHSYLYVNEKGVKELAREADNERDKIDFKNQPFFGIPYAVKDNILVKGMSCTAGSKILENYIAPYDATVISKLKNKGAIVLGKTNLDEFAMGSSTENSAYGPTKNPVDKSRVPGGSSGGSAAAVAAELAPFALGSDTGGSIRQPAAFCGVVGFKPTYGAVSRYGLVALASSLDQIGPITKTVSDAKLVFGYLLGKDNMDATSRDIEKLKKESFSNKLIKIGIPKEYFAEGLDDRIKDRVYEVIDVYKKLGLSIKEISLPHTSFALAVYYIIMPSEASSNLARYDGLRYGVHRKKDSLGDLLDDYLKIRGDNFGKEALKRIMLGTYTLSAGYYDAYYLKAQKVRALIDEDFSKAFKEVDVIISPTTPTTAFKFGENTKDPIQMYLSDIYTVSANLAGIPAISVPCGTINHESIDLPVGFQLMGPKKDDFKVLYVAEMYEKAIKS